MPLTGSEANNIMRRMLKVFPTSIGMLTFQTADEARAELGYDPQAPAFYDSGYIYVILEMADFETAVLLVGHEIGHQFFDPGSIIPYYVVARLYAKQKALDRHQISNVQKMVNVYSDIVVNNILWNDKRFSDEFGAQTIENAFGKFYGLKARVSMLESQGGSAFKGGPYQFVQGGMAAGYFRKYNRSKFQSILNGLKPSLKETLNNIDFLITERNFAVREVQKYYDVAVKIVEGVQDNI